MSRVLRRPMFRGGSVESRGTGITSGFVKPKRGSVDEAGRYSVTKEEVDEYLRTQREVRESLRPEPGLSMSDYLRIASAGAEIAGAPGEGPGLKGLFTTAAKPLSKLGTDLATSMDRRDALSASEASDITQAIIKARTVKQGSTYALDSKLNLLFNYTNELNKIKDQLLTQKDPIERKKLLQRKSVLEEAVSVIKPVDNFLKAYLDTDAGKKEFERVKKKIAIEKGFDVNKDDSWKSKISMYDVGERIKNTFKQKDDEEYANGGRVGLQEGGMVDAMEEEVVEEPGDQEMTMQEETVKPLSYQELRERLPKEINDDIVLLISKSTQAYLDFANIATQKDVLDFNNKYGVELVLPQV